MNPYLVFKNQFFQGDVSNGTYDSVASSILCNILTICSHVKDLYVAISSHSDAKLITYQHSKESSTTKTA
jgi:hypothetical protein